jgi:hypothetical protein
MYLFKLLLNITTATIEALFILGNKFLYACVKEVCRVWDQPCFDTYLQVLIIDDVLSLQQVPQVGKQVVAAWSEIRAVKRVVKELPGEIL